MKYIWDLLQKMQAKIPFLDFWNILVFHFYEPACHQRALGVTTFLTLASRAWQSCSRVVLMWGTPILRCLLELYRATPGGYDFRRRRGRRLTFTSTKASAHSYFKHARMFVEIAESLCCKREWARRGRSASLGSPWREMMMMVAEGSGGCGRREFRRFLKG